MHHQLLSNAVLLVGLIALQGTQVAYSQSTNIKNDVFWDTRDGKPIYSQGGGIFRFKDPKTSQEKFYWYGVRYEGAERYREDPSVTNNRGSRFNSVTCYTSTDLVNWTSEGDALTKEAASKNGRTGWLGRMGVAYMEETEKYVMVIQHGNGVLFAVADEPAGPFEWNHRKDMTETIGTPNTGDQTVFTDPDTGKDYLIYSYGRGRNKIYVSEIGLKEDRYDLLDCTQVYKGSGREGNCMFKYKGKYYIAASQLYGWDSSLAFNSLNSWDLDVPAGKWRVANDNNWVKNDSFEADRKDMPSGEKPKQERLRGWETTVNKGTKVSLERGSPQLNQGNSTEDRKQVIGERSLNMSDRVDFSRQVHQEIASSPYVKFEDGEYTMTAKVMNSDGFEKLEMYAKSGGKKFATQITGGNSEWKAIRLEGIRVSGNKVEIGFHADGKAGAFCRVDDVSFVKAK